MVSITINGTSLEAEEGTTILAAAAAAGVYIPSLCHHPDLPPFDNMPLAARVFRGDQCYENEPFADDDVRSMEGCALCVVEVAGSSDPVRACRTPVKADLAIWTESDSLAELRRANLMKIMATHPHACLTCAQREGCSLEDCSTDVAKPERCCSRFHNCELRKVAEYVGIKGDTPRYRPAGLPVLDGEPLFVRTFDLCIDCARCVRVCNQVRGVGALGLVSHGGRLIVGSVAPTLIESACKFCGACVEVCPTGCLADKDAPAGERERWLLPCVHACPAGVDVPGYIRRIAAGDFEQAAAVVWEKLPLPNTLGYICFHLCESECRRARVDEPIAICALKRFALENDGGTMLADAVGPPVSGKMVAIVGAGPAGLAAACALRFKGHAVSVFEAAESAGGMPALSLPTYRLPPAVIEKDLAVIRALGVDIRTGFHLPDEEAMVDLLNQGFDALLVAVGLPRSRRITIEGSGLDGVFWGLEFLQDVKAGTAVNLGERVIVVGGGNVAIDVAMTALRLSQGTVRLFCLESREEMPAYAEEVEKAEAEGVEINCRWGPAAIREARRKVGRVEFQRCLSVFDEHGNVAPAFDSGERISADADSVILAIGQAAPESVPAQREGVFWAGDIAGGEMSAVHAVASGSSAAERIDLYLGGDGRPGSRPGDRPPPSAWIGSEEGFVPRSRVQPACLSAAQRRKDFRLIEETYRPEEAVAEAKRCLQCDLRLMITRPVTPPERWQELSYDTVEHVPAVAGAFVMAGADKKPTVIKGTDNLQAALFERLESPGDACFFRWEEDRMYTKRESELIQQHLTRYGELPGGGDDELDDLF